MFYENIIFYILINRKQKTDFHYQMCFLFEKPKIILENNSKNRLIVFCFYLYLSVHMF